MTTRWMTMAPPIKHDQDEFRIPDNLCPGFLFCMPPDRTQLIAMLQHQQHRKIFRALLIVQATYTMLSGLWPLVDIDSFMVVTGYKHDVWLVKTVGSMLIPVAACLYAYLFVDTDRRPVIILGAGTALTFACIDFYYALTNVIANIYLVDGLIEIFFLATWIYVAASGPGRKT